MNEGMSFIRQTKGLDQIQASMSSPSKNQIEVQGARYEGAVDMEFSGKNYDGHGLMMSSSLTPKEIGDEDNENLILVLS